MTKNIEIEGTGPYKIYFNSRIRTTVTELNIVNSGYEDYEFNNTHQYEVCSCPEERVGGTIGIQLENSDCVRISNPMVNFTGYENLTTYTIDLPDDLSPVDYFTSYRGEYMLMSAIDDTAACNAVPQVAEIEDEKVFGKLSDGTWLVFDPRLNLDENTLDNPLIDGGKSNELVSGGGTLCSNVPKTFLNEDQCR